MPPERPAVPTSPTVAPAADRPAGDGVGPSGAIFAAMSEPPGDQSATVGPWRTDGVPTTADQAQTVPLCQCGHKVLARGLCSTCYSRVRNHAIRQGSWAGQTQEPHAVQSAKARAALSVLRMFRVSRGYWPSGAMLLRLAEPGDHRRNLAAGLNELIDSGIVAHQLAIVGLAHRVVVPQLGHKVGSK
jgi:hypothetical protein